MNRLISTLISVSILTACAAPVVKDTLLIQQTAMEQAKGDNQDVDVVLNEARDLQITAQREDLYFYSPTYIQQAEEQLAKAENALKTNQPTQIILTHALAGKQLLSRGLENKQTVLLQLKPTLDGIDMLTKLDSHKLLAKDFKEIQEDTKDLIVLFEQGKNTQALKEQTDVLADIHKLEIKTLKKTYLLPAETAFEKAEDVNADDYAPQLFTEAKLKIKQFEKFIETNTTQRQEISIQAIQAIHLAQHAKHVAEAAKPLLKLNNEQAEQHILSFEKMLARLGTALNHDDVSYLPLDSQSIALAQAAEIINKQAQALKNQGQWEKEKVELEKQISALKKATQQPVKAIKIGTEISKPEQNTTADIQTSTSTTPDTTQQSNGDNPIEPTAQPKETTAVINAVKVAPATVNAGDITTPAINPQPTLAPTDEINTTLDPVELK